MVTEVGGYSSSQILQALGVQTEENIFSFDPAAKEAGAGKAVPAAGIHQVVRDYPNTVVVQATEAGAYLRHADEELADPLGSVLKILSEEPPSRRGLHPLRRRAGVCDTRRPAGLCSAADAGGIGCIRFGSAAEAAVRPTTVWMR